MLRLVKPAPVLPAPTPRISAENAELLAAVQRGMPSVVALVQHATTTLPEFYFPDMRPEEDDSCTFDRLAATKLVKSALKTMEPAALAAVFVQLMFDSKLSGGAADDPDLGAKVIDDLTEIAEASA
ncbi:hypothetical protein BurJ1DRAFT_2563 [Burkholderiales bacterium JOSHI_001]|nr:hypothetical protein BurJ1DRAFT_2563 [Burkholderiales bacterium JOSHI_001]